MFHVRCYHCYCTIKHWYFIQQGLVAICPLGFLFVLRSFVARGMFHSDTIYKFILTPYKANSICSIYSILNKSSCFSLDKNLLCYWHSCEHLREFCQLIHASGKTYFSTSSTNMIVILKEMWSVGTTSAQEFNFLIEAQIPISKHSDISPV